MNISFLKVDLNNIEHTKQIIRLLDAYMRDEMGNNSPMPEGMAPQIIKGLKSHPAYLGFFALADGEFIALANCNKNFSTFKAKPIINIHDFVVHSNFRGKGAGKFMLDSIAQYGRQNGFCRINLEVRNDNVIAQNLYKAVGYQECQPPMFFWEKVL